MDGWVEREIEGCEFPDERLRTRFGKLLGQLGEKIGAALPTACQDWAATKAAYRFFDNPRVDESIILAGHFAATKSRMAVAKGPLLILLCLENRCCPNNLPPAQIIVQMVARSLETEPFRKSLVPFQLANHKLLVRRLADAHRNRPCGQKGGAYRRPDKCPATSTSRTGNLLFFCGLDFCMSEDTFLLVLVVGIPLAGVLCFVGLIYESSEAGRQRRAAKEEAKRQLNPKIVCPQCHERGYVTTEQVRENAGIHGGKATAALLTGGVSMLATGLSSELGKTQATCSNCGSIWRF